MDAFQRLVWHQIETGEGPFWRAKVSNSAFDEQVGGSHYRDMAIQPAEYIHRNGIGFMEGSAIAYLSRHKAKGGVEDLRKARHFIDLLIEMELENAR